MPFCHTVDSSASSIIDPVSFSACPLHQRLDKQTTIQCHAFTWAIPCRVTAIFFPLYQVREGQMTRWDAVSFDRNLFLILWSTPSPPTGNPLGWSVPATWSGRNTSWPSASSRRCAVKTRPLRLAPASSTTTARSSASAITACRWAAATIGCPGARRPRTRSSPSICTVSPVSEWACGSREEHVCACVHGGSPRSPLSGCLYRDVIWGTEYLYPIQIQCNIAEIYGGLAH